MANVKRKCKVCGAEYVVCSTALNTHDRFAYEKVACSPACGAEYFRRVMEARGELAQPQVEAVEVVDPIVSEEATEAPAVEAVCGDAPAEEEVAEDSDEEEDEGLSFKSASKRKK